MSNTIIQSYCSTVVSRYAKTNHTDIGYFKIFKNGISLYPKTIQCQ